MNNEIKEILAYFEEYVKITDMHDSEPMLNWKDLKIVLDYITNLQQENERLKQDYINLRNYIKMRNVSTEVEDKALLYNIELENINKKKYLDYKTRCEKAIEYINHAQNYGTMAQVMPHLKPYVNGDDLLNILQNGSKEK